MQIREKISRTFLFSFIGSILITINIVLILLNGGKPIVIASYPANKVEEVMGVDQFWGRIVLGREGLVEGLWAYIWLFIAVIMLVCSWMIFSRPKKQSMWGIPIVILSLLSITTGGGFAIGLILSFIGGMAAIEWPKPFGETFIGKFLRALKLDSKLFAKAGEDPNLSRSALWTLIISGFLAGIGACTYAYNVDLIKSGVLGLDRHILIEGALYFRNFQIISAVTYVALLFIKWLIISLLIYLVAVKITGFTTDLEGIARMTAFAYTPTAFQVFLPILITNEPFLSFNWPLMIQIITSLWIFVALVVGLKTLLEISAVKSFAIVLFCGTLYLLITERIIYSLFEVPGILITFPQGSSVLLILMSLSTFVAVVLGAFSRTS
jgi:hypothetical protein